ncbi:MAG: S9 family peptidase [Myxococcota bacterium]|nr:S9 family peptidase [Myxococcota bacterium]
MDRNINHLSVCAFIAVALAIVPEAAAKKPSLLDVDQLFGMAWLSDLTVSPDEPVAAFVVKRFSMEKNKATSSIWIVSLDTGTVRRLTRSNNSDWAPRWRRPGELAFLSRRSGTAQVWSIDIHGGEARQLTDLPLEINNFAIAPDGMHLAAQIMVYPECKTLRCTAKKIEQQKKSPVKARIYDALLYRVWDTWRDGRVGHIWWVPLKGGKPRDLTPGNWQTPPLDLGSGMDLSISPDSKHVAFTANATEQPAWNTNNDIFIVPVAGGKPENITAANKACDAGPAFSPDGRTLAYLAMERPGYEADHRVLTLYDLKTKNKTPLTKALDRSVSQFAWSKKGHEILFAAPDQGHKPVYRLFVNAKRFSKLIDKHTNSYPQYGQRGDTILFLQQRLSRPPEVHAASIFGSGERPLTKINGSRLANIKMGASQEITFAGADTDPVHGFLITPPGFRANKKYPLLVLIHGGPQGMVADAFHPRWNLQLFAAAGIVVAAFNFHGSSGYGRAFKDAVSKDWGGKPYEDIMKGVTYVTKKFKFIDPRNVSAVGASYGGYMINWILGNTDRFRCLISHAGVFDHASFYGATEELWFPEWEFNGTPWSNPALYAKHTPSQNVKRFKTPTLVIHGEHDYRVPYTQGLQLFTALQRQGVASKLLFFPDETHFVKKPQNAKLWWHTMLGWIAEHANIPWQPPDQVRIKKSRGPKKKPKK